MTHKLDFASFYFLYIQLIKFIERAATYAPEAIGSSS
jgi:hypothetical protein